MTRNLFVVGGKWKQVQRDLELHHFEREADEGGMRLVYIALPQPTNMEKIQRESCAWVPAEKVH